MILPGEFLNPVTDFSVVNNEGLFPLTHSSVEIDLCFSFFVLSLSTSFDGIQYLICSSVTLSSKDKDFICLPLV